MNFLNENLKRWDELFLDRTFRIAPYGSKQLVTLLYCRTDPDTHKNADDEAVPILFCLLRDSDASTYEYMFNRFLEHIPRLERVEQIFIALDFDKDMIKVIQSKLKNTILVGCSFHLKQAINRWIDKN